MSFSLLKTRDLWREINTPSSDGSWVDGVYYPDSSPTINYTAFQGDYEPLSTGQKKQILPEGINSTDAIIVFSEVELKTSIHNGNIIEEGETIFLQNPLIHVDTIPYLVFDKETWLTNDGFSLLDNDNFDYVCIRQELQ